MLQIMTLIFTGGSTEKVNKTFLPTKNSIDKGEYETVHSIEIVANT